MWIWASVDVRNYLQTGEQRNDAGIPLPRSTTIGAPRKNEYETIFFLWGSTATLLSGPLPFRT